MSYNLTYYDNQLREHSPTAHLIAATRWKWVADCKPDTVLDYGSGVGWFRAFAPESIQVDTIDPMRVPQTRITRQRYDLITFWNVISHMTAEYIEGMPPLLERCKYLAASIPIFPGGIRQRDWIHYKPEYRHIYSRRSFEMLLEKYGFRLLKLGYPECPPQRDMCSFLFKNDGYTDHSPVKSSSAAHRGGSAAPARDRGGTG